MTSEAGLDHLNAAIARAKSRGAKVPCHVDTAPSCLPCPVLLNCRAFARTNLLEHPTDRSA